MTTFYLGGEVPREVSSAAVIDGLGHYYGLDDLTAIVKKAYGRYHVPTSLDHVNGKINEYVDELRSGEVPYFMGVQYLVYVEHIDPYKKPIQSS